MAVFYNISIRLYVFIIRIASIFNPKAKLWLSGRKHIFKKIEGQLAHEKHIIWFHCASLGEFEQGRPVIERFKKQHPHTKILLTFFSPSGYEVRKNYEGADYIFYLPIDTKANASRFLSIVNPELVFFVKYEFWFNYIRTLKERAIPFYVISANFRKNQHFFKWYGGWFRKQLSGITHIFVQKNDSLELLNSIGIQQVTVAGDTRFDRVYEITRNVKTFPVIQQFCNNQSVFIAGSSWPADEELLCSLINSDKTNYRFIIAPHVVDKPHVISLTEKIKKPLVLYSEANEQNITQANVLIIDCIGILSHVYQYGKVAYIGGGFGAGIHNILEAATFGMPVIFGPKYQKFREAIDLIAEGGAFSISDEKDLTNIVMKLHDDPATLEKTATIAATFVQKNIGATDIILKATGKFS